MATDPLAGRRVSDLLTAWWRLQQIINVNMPSNLARVASQRDRASGHVNPIPPRV